VVLTLLLKNLILTMQTVQTVVKCIPCPALHPHSPTAVECACTRTCMHGCTHIRTHTYTHTHTRTHTQVRDILPLCDSGKALKGAVQALTVVTVGERVDGPPTRRILACGEGAACVSMRMSQVAWRVSGVQGHVGCCVGQRMWMNGQVGQRKLCRHCM